MLYVIQFCWQLANRIRMEHPDPARRLSANLWHIPLLCVQWKIPDDGQRNCPKHVEFHSKNKFEKLVHIVSSIVRQFSLSIYSTYKKNSFNFPSPMASVSALRFCRHIIVRFVRSFLNYVITSMSRFSKCVPSFRFCEHILICISFHHMASSLHWPWFVSTSLKTYTCNCFCGTSLL